MSTRIEATISSFLNSKNIQFESPKSFYIFGKQLLFDFFIPSENLLIDYYGREFGTTTFTLNYSGTIMNAMKIVFAKNSHYTFLVINYGETNEVITQKLQSALGDRGKELLPR